MSGPSDSAWSLPLLQRKRKLADVLAAAAEAGDATSPSAGGGSGSDSGARRMSAERQPVAGAGGCAKAVRAKRQRLYVCYCHMRS